MPIDQDKLRQEFERLYYPKDLDTCLEYLDIFLDCFFEIVQNHQEDEVYTYREAYAKIVLQMMFSKLVHLKKIIEGGGVTYINLTLHKKLGPFVDPTIVASLVRNIYEMVCMFNVVYDCPSSEDEKAILYYLWVAAGLENRQKFAPVVTPDQSGNKIEDEKKQLAACKKNHRRYIAL